ncbi:MAG: cytochrome C, partial [Nitrospinae bacterium]|nr:cytochrome C [Nitrospinota bacterium]
MKKIFIFITFALFAANAWAQDDIGSLISPGALSEPHAKYEGIGNCTKCHSLGKGVPDSKCLECHDKLAERIKNKEGLHAAYSEACIKCHTDHKGKSFKIISLDKEKFNHDSTGYPLKDKHSGVNCNKCHKKEGVYAGLQKECIFCHEDKHKGQLGKDCSRCHTFKGWKDIEKFNHTRDSKYSLTGRHTEVKCEKCHVRNIYKIEKFEECIACHRDPHKGKPACAECHTTENWKKVKVDHAKTNYPLTGKHIEVSCEKCHKNNQLKGIPYLTCTSSFCHTDAHKNQFPGKPCESCHTTKGWKPPLFNHNAPEYSGFRLDGKHLETACEKCHKEGRYKAINYKTCDTSDCHKDTHKGQFKGKACESCHTVKGWKPPLFNHNAPEYSGFKL